MMDEKQIPKHMAAYDGSLYFLASDGSVWRCTGAALTQARGVQS